MLDGHSFSVESLPAAEEAGGLGFEPLTPRTMLVPREAFAGELAASYLAAEGLAPLEGECAVWSDTQQQTVAVMAIDRAVLDALHAKYGSLLYVKVYRTILQLAEVIRAENDADVLYFVERLAGIFPPADYELHVEGEGGAALRKLLKGYYKRIVCE